MSLPSAGQPPIFDPSFPVAGSGFLALDLPTLPISPGAIGGRIGWPGGSVWEDITRAVLLALQGKTLTMTVTGIYSYSYNYYPTGFPANNQSGSGSVGVDWTTTFQINFSTAVLGLNPDTSIGASSIPGIPNCMPLGSWIGSLEMVDSVWSNQNPSTVGVGTYSYNGPPGPTGSVSGNVTASGGFALNLFLVCREGQTPQIQILASAGVSVAPDEGLNAGTPANITAYAAIASDASLLPLVLPGGFVSLGGGTVAGVALVGGATAPIDNPYVYDPGTTGTGSASLSITGITLNDA